MSRTQKLWLFSCLFGMHIAFAFSGVVYLVKGTGTWFDMLGGVANAACAVYWHSALIDVELERGP